MSKFFLTILVITLILQKVQASEVKYLLYHISNQVKLKVGGKEEKAKRGAFISSNQSIIISTLSEVMLVQDDGKSMLLNKPGIFTFQQIKNLFSKVKPNSVTSNFFAYVFEKFLSADTDEEKQKVSASVFRGNPAMLYPVDSSFILSFPIVLKWLPEQKNIPYKITFTINEIVSDTIIRNKTLFSIPDSLLNPDNARLLKWLAAPLSNKENQQPVFTCIIPLRSDIEIIQNQLKQLKTAYAKKPDMLRLMEKDLFERWLEVYQLN